MEKSIFSDEWRRCLREHYKHVIREQDQTTENSLTKVLLSAAVNFSEAELRDLYVEATSRADEMPDGFLPDLARAGADLPEAAQIVAVPEDDRTFRAHPAECTCPTCMESSYAEYGHDKEGQPLTPEELEARKEEQGHEDQDGDDPKQMSMF